MLIPKVSDANGRIASDAVRKASPYVRRHKAVTSAKADKKPSRLNVPGNPLADFSKSGKGGLANDPDEQLAIDELQRYLGIPVTGKYDQTTRDAVSAYQKRNKLKVDGDAGPETIGHMMGNDNPKKYTPPAQGQDNNPNKDGGQKSDADQRKSDAKKDLKNGVAPEDEQVLENAIKFNWKKKSYYVSVTKVEKNEANNNIAWVFYKDDKLTQGQKVATLGSHWEAQLEKELKRRSDAGSKKAKDALEIINPEGVDVKPGDGVFAPAQTGGEADTDADVDAGIVEDIYDAVKGAGTDEDDLFAALRGIRDNAHYKTIARMFKKEYPDAIGGKFPTLAIWMRDDLEGWLWDGDDVKKFDREMNRLGVNIKKPIPAENLAKGEEVNTTKGKVVGTGEQPKDKPKDGGNPGGSQSSAQDNNPNKGDGGGKADDKKKTTDPKDQQDDDTLDGTANDKEEKPSTDKKEKPSTDKAEDKPFTTKQQTYMGELAEKLLDAMDGIGTDEDAIKTALSKISTVKQYNNVNKLFQELEDNDDKESLEKWITGELDTKDMNTYYWSELRRIKVPHTIGSGELRRLKSFMGTRKYDEEIAPFYDKQGKFLPKGKPKGGGGK